MHWRKRCWFHLCTQRARALNFKRPWQSACVGLSNVDFPRELLPESAALWAFLQGGKRYWDPSMDLSEAGYCMGHYQRARCRNRKTWIFDSWWQWGTLSSQNPSRKHQEWTCKHPWRNNWNSQTRGKPTKEGCWVWTLANQNLLWRAYWKTWGYKFVKTDHFRNGAVANPRQPQQWVVQALTAAGWTSTLVAEKRKFNE